MVQSYNGILYTAMRMNNLLQHETWMNFIDIVLSQKIDMLHDSIQSFETGNTNMI